MFWLQHMDKISLCDSCVCPEMLWAKWTLLSTHSQVWTSHFLPTVVLEEWWLFGSTCLPLVSCHLSLSVGGQMRCFEESTFKGNLICPLPGYVVLERCCFGCYSVPSFLMWDDLCSCIDWCWPIVHFYENKLCVYSVLCITTIALLSIKHRKTR